MADMGSENTKPFLRLYSRQSDDTSLGAEGAAHVHQCKVEEKIPVFLVVSGALCLLGGVTSVRRSRGERIDTCCCSYTCDSVNTVDTGNLSYCQPTLYFFAFCYVTIKWIMAVLAAMALPFVMTSFSLPFTVQSPGGRHGYSPF
uniref:Uncharacterized protein n=1 Tax=Branchiostoma floridae TaxID=7739 RepID=C3ZWX6_BRAFL|eukprot:XP_002586927.1 hypothetical protein BRAFLDRAFT_103587 [Branchiostoma floridae]